MTHTDKIPNAQVLKYLPCFAWSINTHMRKYVPVSGRVYSSSVCDRNYSNAKFHHVLCFPELASNVTCARCRTVRPRAGSAVQAQDSLVVQAVAARAQGGVLPISRATALCHHSLAALSPSRHDRERTLSLRLHQVRD